MATKKEGSEFIVRLDGLKLSRDAEARINKEIQTAVLREIAGIDTGGNFAAHYESFSLNFVPVVTKSSTL